MKKLSKILCAVLIVAVLFCLHTVAFAEDTEAPVADYQILGPMGSSDLDGNLLITTDGAQILLEADFGGVSLDALAWDVISGKDVLSVHAREGFEGEAIVTPLANGEATVIAYLEDGSQVTATRKIIVSNQTVETATTATLSISREGNGTIIRKAASGEELNMGTSYTNPHDIGMVVDLTAVEADHPFKYWVVSRSGNKDIIVSTELTYTFTLVEDISVKAVFDKTDDGSFYGINTTFLYNNIVASNVYVKKLAQDVPSAPYQRNMTFDQWTAEGINVEEVLADSKVTKAELNGATTFTATYTPKDVECAITVIGGSGSGTYAYGQAVTATVTATAEEGKQFLFWSKDGAPVSYDATYQFSAMQDCTIVAVFGEAVTGDGINMVMQAPVVDGNMLAFTFERYVPESYDFVSSGFVVSKISDCERGDTTNNLMEAVSYRDGARTQFTKSLKKVSGVSTYYARGYVIYMDNGEVKTIYTESQKIVIE